MKNILLNQPQTVHQRPVVLEKLETTPTRRGEGIAYAELTYEFNPKAVPHGEFIIKLRWKAKKATKLSELRLVAHKDDTLNYNLEWVNRRLLGTGLHVQLQISTDWKAHTTIDRTYPVEAPPVGTAGSGTAV